MLRASIRNGIKTVYLHAINFKPKIRNYHPIHD